MLLDTLVSFFQLWIILTQLHVNIQLFWFSALYSYFSFFSHSKVDMEEDIWRRDCFSPDDGFVGCKQGSRNNGSSSCNFEICVCEGSLCNIKMGDISTSTSKSTTHKGKHWFIICFHWLMNNTHMTNLLKLYLNFQNYVDLMMPTILLKDIISKT